MKNNKQSACNQLAYASWLHPYNLLCSSLQNLIFELIVSKMTAILYHDPQITIYRELIVINKYYFPLATSRNILLSEIERVTVYDSEGVTHRWGLCRKYLNNWFPLDNNRKNKSKFIEIIVKGKKMRPSITPDDPEKVVKIIWENFTPEGREYVEKRSESMGKQTEIAQQELIEREKQAMEVSEQHLTGTKIKQEDQIETK